jgi:hypothetical protein
MLFKCPIYETERATLLTYIQDNCKNFEHLSSDNKLIWLLSNEDTLLSNKLAVFLNFIANIMIYIKIYIIQIKYDADITWCSYHEYYFIFK